MPPINTPDDHFSMMRELDRRLRNMENCPQLPYASITGGQLTIFDDSGRAILILGKQTDGTYGLRQLDASGNEIISIGAQADGSYGLWQYSPAGTLETKLGLINASPAIYGLAVLNVATGLLQQVGGVSSALTAAVQATTSLTYVSLTGDPVVTAAVGASGAALVFFGARIGTNNANEQGLVGLSVDSGAPAAPFAAVGTSAAGGANADSILPVIVTGLAAGSHTFSLQYRTAFGNSVNFSDRSVTVQPL